MHPTRRWLTSMVATTVLLASGPAQAATTSPDFKAAAAAWVAAAPVPAATQFEVRVVQRWRGGARARIAQRLSGLPVIGRELILSFAPDGALRWASGSAVGGQLPGDAPRVGADDAMSIGQRLVAALAGGSALVPPTASLAAWIDDDAHRVWDVRATSADPPGSYRVLVDADTGVVRSWGMTSSDVRGRVYPSNPATSSLTEVDLLGTSASGLRGPYALVASCTELGSLFGSPYCTDTAVQAHPDAQGDYLFDPAFDAYPDPFAEVQMQHHLDRVGRWFDEVLGHDAGAPIEGLVNFRYPNAFYGDFDLDGLGEVAFGEWEGADFSYDADIVYHEYGHAVFGQIVTTAGFQNADDYGRDYAAGALNEGSADALAIALSGDPLLGEYIGAALSDGQDAAVRDLRAPRRCPDDLYGEVHEDGEVWGALVWALMDDPAIGPARAADLAYGTLLGLPDIPTWAEAGTALVAAAEDLADAGWLDAAGLAAVRAHGDATGVVGCGRSVDLASGARPTLLMLATDQFEEDTHVPASLQFHVAVPEGGSRIRVRIANWRSVDTPFGWRFMARRGEAVHHEVRRRTLQDWQVLVSQPWNYDLAVDGSGDGFELTLDRRGFEVSSGEVIFDDVEPMRAGDTWYFAIASRVTEPIGHVAAADVTIEGDLLIDPSYRRPLGPGCRDCGGDGTPGGFALLLVGTLRRRRR